MSEKRVIARRALRDQSTAEVVELTIYEPQEEAEGEQQGWNCRYEIRRGANDVFTSVAYGVDSLQSLFSALAALRRGVAGSITRLTWFGEPGAIGLPIMISEDDPDLARLLEHIVEAEYCRQVLAAKRTEKRGPG